ncbi:hypothetical protein KJN74_00335 [Candidatus Bathyarchaeota archaeon]|nr:hypothetical protein [Candidatus Bathyarchaeota archaeon]
MYQKNCLPTEIIIFFLYPLLQSTKYQRKIERFNKYYLWVIIDEIYGKPNKNESEHEVQKQEKHKEDTFYERTIFEVYYFGILYTKTMH